MTREDVISWLEYLSDDARSKADGLVPTNIEIACGMAIDALKAHELRVLALDEIHRGMVVWLEYKDKPEPILAIGGASAGMAKCFITVNDMSVSALDDEYNIRWRAWTDCPSKEEMGAIPWN